MSDVFDYIYADTDAIQQGSDDFMGVHRALVGEIEDLESQLKNRFLVHWQPDSASSEAFHAAFARCKNDLNAMLTSLTSNSALVAQAAEMYHWTEGTNAAQYG